MDRYRLLPSINEGGPMQMAIDEAVVISCSEGKSPPTLRFYTFAPPAITIGYHQEVENFGVDEIREKGFDFVRRITGGTAVLHKNDLVYSLVLPEFSLPNKITDAYNYLSDALVYGLKEIGLRAKKKKLVSEERKASCYLNSNPYDIVVNSKKISGNAQARIRGVVLQHGTIIIENNLPELFDCLTCEDRQRKDLLATARKKVTSVEKELGRRPSIAEVEEAMISGFRSLFSQKGISFRKNSLTDYETTLAEKLYREKYSTDRWNYNC